MGQRWEPRLRELIHELDAGTIDTKEFPPLRQSQAVFRAMPTEARESRRIRERIVVIFVIGGITLPEVRVVHETSNALGIEVFLGGSCMLTPSALLNSRKNI